MVNSAFHGLLNDNAHYIATIFSPDSSLLMEGPAIVSIYENLKCAFAVTNRAPFDIYLQRGAIIGLIKTEDKSDKNESLTLANIEQKANLNVPSKFRSKYVDLLFKHRAAISIGKHNLGHARHFQH